MNVIARRRGERAFQTTMEDSHAAGIEAARDMNDDLLCAPSTVRCTPTGARRVCPCGGMRRDAAPSSLGR
jgi:hypothetical protein